jgi:DNA-binding NarL/FixJ family response regulator
VQGRQRLRDGATMLIGRTVVVFRSPSGRESLRTDTSHAFAVPKVSEAQLRVLTALCRPLVRGQLAVPATNRQIADELVLGTETVKTHMRALFAAFGVEELPQHQKRAALAQRALRTGLVAINPGPASG